MNRCALWDNLKMVLIICMVVGHFAEKAMEGNPSFGEIKLFIYAFHMPLFIFISGLYHRDQNLKKRIVFLLSVGFLWKVIRSLSVILLYHEYHFSLLSEGGVPWFMFSLAAFSFMTWLLRKQNLKWILFLNVLLACFIGFDKSIGDFLCISRIVIFYPFYLAGVMLQQEEIVSLKKKVGFRGTIVGVVILMIWAGLSVFRYEQVGTLLHLFTGRNHFSEAIWSVGLLCRLVCYGITGILIISLILLVPDQKIKGITKIGENTINVYFWHYLVLEILVCLCGFGDLANQSAFGKVLYLSSAIVVAVVLGEFEIFGFPCRSIKKIIYNCD